MRPNISLMMPLNVVAHLHATKEGAIGGKAALVRNETLLWCSGVGDDL